MSFSLQGPITPVEPITEPGPEDEPTTPNPYPVSDPVIDPDPGPGTHPEPPPAPSPPEPIPQFPPDVTF